jgi:dihydropyrimidinase
MIVFPGFIDTRVHLQQPQGIYQVYTADDFRSGTISAALGGTTTVIDFVQPKEGY